MFNKILSFLTGKKTYVVAILMLIKAFHPLMVGDITVPQFLNGPEVDQILQAFGLTFLRNGISKATTK